MLKSQSSSQSINRSIWLVENFDFVSYFSVAFFVWFLLDVRNGNGNFCIARQNAADLQRSSASELGWSKNLMSLQVLYTVPVPVANSAKSVFSKGSPPKNLSCIDFKCIRRRQQGVAIAGTAVVLDVVPLDLLVSPALLCFCFGRRWTNECGTRESLHTGFSATCSSSE